MPICPNTFGGSSKTPICLNTVPPVVVDFFSSQTVVGVEGVDTAVCLPIAQLSGIPPRTEDFGDGSTAVANLPRLTRWKYVCNPKRKRNLHKSRRSEA